MQVFITGAAGNLGSHLARHLLEASDHHLNLMIHKTPLPPDLPAGDRISVFACNLGNPESLNEACAQSDVIIHFAGVLFAPNPQTFLPTTNTQYAKHLIDTAIQHRVKRFILISFPHVEGPTTLANPCTDRLNGSPISMHAKTRLAEEQYLFAHAQEHSMQTIVLRPGMIYGRDILMVAFAKALARKWLLGVWREPTPIHLIAIDDFLACCAAAINNPKASGIYPLGDDAPTTLQSFLRIACQQWGVKRPWVVPLWSVHSVAWVCERIAQLFSARSPFTGDFIDLGRVPYCCDTTRMKDELRPQLTYPSLATGRHLL